MRTPKNAVCCRKKERASCPEIFRDSTQRFVLVRVRKKGEKPSDASDLHDEYRTQYFVGMFPF